MGQTRPTTQVKVLCVRNFHINLWTIVVWQAEQTIGGSNGLEPSAAPVVLPAAALGCTSTVYFRKAEAEMVPSDNGTAEVGIREQA